MQEIEQQEVALLSQLPIRKKILYITILLMGALALMLHSSLSGVFAYRQLTKSIGALSYEFHEMWKVGQEVAELRAYFREDDELTERPFTFKYIDTNERAQFLAQLDVVRNEIKAHERRLVNESNEDLLLTAAQQEIDLIVEMKGKLDRIEIVTYDLHPYASTQFQQIRTCLDDIGDDAQSLFAFMTDRMRSCRAEMRSSYHTWIFSIISSASVAIVTIVASFVYFRRSVVQPFKLLLEGSREIAKGKFDTRIHLQSHDELSELADAQNKMTSLFVEIRDNLHEKVKERTREVVRSEQLASVGFLAAGVAHEINNPLASIAWSAEALESRLHEILHPAANESESQVEDADNSSETNDFTEATGGIPLAFKPTNRTLGPTEEEKEQIEILRRYLRRIQDEAFRCKGITERLLDFSRLGDAQVRQEISIYDSVTDVIALVKHLGQYRRRSVEFEGDQNVIGLVSPTEFKQVILNLLTNSLDASDDGGVVKVKLEQLDMTFALTITDHGCGMSDEVMKHLFEPFFTRRRDGRGTGLGLSITYRIVQDHGGTLTPFSEGEGRGSKFVLTMPSNSSQSRLHETSKAA